ncbi:four helix bundle protein [Candidatus Uhrbacteria bacterium]|nr:four helix bundle protein [Candidatus Uhrbacteria bacterium]
MFITKLLSYPPPQVRLPIIAKLISAYRQWQEWLGHFPKNSKYTLGSKIDDLFIEIIENIFTASYLPSGQKLPLLQKASSKLDLLKFFLQISWEIKALDKNKYIRLSEPLNEVGKMLGGWSKQITSTK